MKNTRERERDQTHSYWYMPSASRVNYSLLIMESAGMMKMATGEGSPPFGRVPELAPERFLVATEACGGGTPDLSSVFESFRVREYIWVQGVCRWSFGGPTRQGARPRGCP